MTSQPVSSIFAATESKFNQDFSQLVLCVWPCACELSRFLQNDFDQYSVSTAHCPVVEQAASPVSIIILNKASGSRTILHTNK